MDLTRIEQAIALRDSGRFEEAIREFQSMAQASSDPNEMSSCLLNELRCYSLMGRVNDAERILSQIHGLAPDDIIVRANVEHGTACVAAQAGHHEKAILLFQAILEQYCDLLQTSDYRDLYEDVQLRRAFSLAHLGRYDEMFPILQEAASFNTLQVVDKQRSHLFLGICYSRRHQNGLAREQFFRVIDLGLVNEFEAEARYRLASTYFVEQGFAQTKHQLEFILAEHPQHIERVPRRYIYEQLSQVCHYLGEDQNAKSYKKLAENS